MSPGRALPLDASPLQARHSAVLGGRKTRFMKTHNLPSINLVTFGIVTLVAVHGDPLGNGVDAGSCEGSINTIESPIGAVVIAVETSLADKAIPSADRQDSRGHWGWLGRGLWDGHHGNLRSGASPLVVSSSLTEGANHC